MYSKIAYSAGILIIVWQLQSATLAVSITEFQHGNIHLRTEAKGELKVEPAQSTQSTTALIAPASRIVFVGDILLARNVEKLMGQHGNEYPFAGLRLKDATSTALVGNFESSMSSSHTMTPAFMMRFSVHEAFLPVLKNVGFTHLSLANNHSFDYGVEGYTHTKEALTALGTAVFGHGSVIGEQSVSYLETERGIVALIGLHTSAVIPEDTVLQSLLLTASQKSDLQIVYIHWGNEYELVHSRAQEAVATTLVEAGADLIIGHHPHVVQDIALIEGVPVFYSLGNYIFDQYFSKDVQQGLVVTLFLSGTPEITLLPVTSEYTHSQPAELQDEERVAFLQALARRSDPELAEAVIRGVIPLPLLVATSTEMAIMMR